MVSRAWGCPTDLHLSTKCHLAVDILTKCQLICQPTLSRHVHVLYQHLADNAITWTALVSCFRCVIEMMAVCAVAYSVNIWIKKTDSSFKSPVVKWKEKGDSCHSSKTMVYKTHKTLTVDRVEKQNRPYCQGQANIALEQVKIEV